MQVQIDFRLFSDDSTPLKFKFQLARAGAPPWPTAIPNRRSRPPFRGRQQPWSIKIKMFFYQKIETKMDEKENENEKREKYLLRKVLGVAVTVVDKQPPSTSRFIE